MERATPHDTRRMSKSELLQSHSALERENRRLADLLRIALTKLMKPKRDDLTPKVLHLHHQGMTYNAIAAETGLTYHSVRSRIRTARGKAGMVKNGK